MIDTRELEKKILKDLQNGVNFITAEDMEDNDRVGKGRNMFCLRDH